MKPIEIPRDFLEAVEKSDIVFSRQINKVFSKYGYDNINNHYDAERVYRLWAMGCFIHCAKSDFYYRGKWWRVELWMGRYGISVGGEIGFYNRKSQKKPTFYNCSSEGFVMSFTLNEYTSKNTTRKLFTIATNSKYEHLGHWWLTGLKYNTNLTRHPPYSRNLQMKAHITFKDVTMANKFIENLTIFGWTRTKIRVTHIKKTYRDVYIIWSSYNCVLNGSFDYEGVPAR